MAARRTMSCDRFAMSKFFNEAVYFQESSLIFVRNSTESGSVLMIADSDDAAHRFRDDRAHHSEMMPPTRRVVVGG
jgi:hypothetical protein